MIPDLNMIDPLPPTPPPEAVASHPTGPPSCAAKTVRGMQNVITNFGKGRADLTNLPRKINICISPTRDDFPHTHINDLGFQAVVNGDGEVVYNVEVGGYFSIKRNVTSIPLGISVTKDQVRASSHSRDISPVCPHGSCAPLSRCLGDAWHGTASAELGSHSAPMRAPIGGHTGLTV